MTELKPSIQRPDTLSIKREGDAIICPKCLVIQDRLTTPMEDPTESMELWKRRIPPTNKQLRKPASDPKSKCLECQGL
jgi:hypothetical protein